MNKERGPKPTCLLLSPSDRETAYATVPMMPILFLSNPDRARFFETTIWTSSPPPPPPRPPPSSSPSPTANSSRNSRLTCPPDMCARWSSMLVKNGRYGRSPSRPPAPSATEQNTRMAASASPAPPDPRPLPTCVTSEPTTSCLCIGSTNSSNMVRYSALPSPTLPGSGLERRPSATSSRLLSKRLPSPGPLPSSASLTSAGVNPPEAALDLSKLFTFGRLCGAVAAHARSQKSDAPWCPGGVSLIDFNSADERSDRWPSPRLRHSIVSDIPSDFVVVLGTPAGLSDPSSIPSSSPKPRLRPRNPSTTSPAMPLGAWFIRKAVNAGSPQASTVPSASSASAVALSISASLKGREPTASRTGIRRDGSSDRRPWRVPSINAPPPSSSSSPSLSPPQFNKEDEPWTSFSTSGTAPIASSSIPLAASPDDEEAASASRVPQ